MKTLLLTSAICFLAVTLMAQQSQPVGHTHVDHSAMMHHCDHQQDNQSAATTQPQTTPYAGTSAGLTDGQRARYLNGEGMGFAKPAEMNHYPRPRHVLQNAERMKLSPSQIAATQKLFDGVQIRAKALGKQIVEREDELLRMFSSRTANEACVERLTAEIGTLQGELRAVHLTNSLARAQPAFSRTSPNLRSTPGVHPGREASAGSTPTMKPNGSSCLKGCDGTEVGGAVVEYSTRANPSACALFGRR